MTSNRSSHPEVFLRKGVFSGPYFPVFGLNSEYRKIRTRKNSVFGHFPRSESFHVSYFCFCRSSRLEVFCRKGVLRNFTKFTGKHLRHSLLFNEVAGLLPSYRNQSTVLLCKLIDWFLYEGNSRSATLLKRRFWRRSFPVNFAKFLRLPFFTEHFRWLLLFLVFLSKFLPAIVVPKDGTFPRNCFIRRLWRYSQSRMLVFDSNLVWLSLSLGWGILFLIFS